MDKNLENLCDILEYIEKILLYTKDFVSVDEFYRNQVFFDAVLMNFVNIGESVSRVSESFQLAHSEIDWLNIKGLRNMIAHDYLGVDAEEVWQIVKKDIPLLRKSVSTLVDMIK